MILLGEIGAGILDHGAIVFEVRGEASGMSHASAGGNPGKHKVAQAVVAQMHIERCRCKGADGGLVENEIAGLGGDLGKDAGFGSSGATVIRRE